MLWSAHLFFHSPCIRQISRSMMLIDLRESEQGNLLTCKVGMTCDDEDADGIGGRCLGKAPADSGRDVSGMVSGMMSNLQVSSKVQYKYNVPV